MRGLPIYLGNDDEPELVATRKNAGTGAVEAATGLTGVKVRFSATDNGAAINAAVDVAATERGTTGIYAATIDAAVIDTHLTAYAGLDVYEVWYDGANIKTSTPRKVLATRRA